jgi:hypothetical protein
VGSEAAARIQVEGQEDEPKGEAMVKIIGLLISLAGYTFIAWVIRYEHLRRKMEIQRIIEKIRSRRREVKLCDR